MFHTRFRWLWPAAAASVLSLAGCSGLSEMGSSTPAAKPKAAGPMVKTATAVVDGKQQTILVDQKGMTLYYYTPDRGGKVTCTGQCAALWPPLKLPAGVAKPTGDGSLSGALGAVASPGGGEQVTYNGWPLYGWVKDKKPGDTTGQGDDGKWFVVPPDLGSAATAVPLVKTATAKVAGKQEKILVDQKGMTLYYYTPDKGGKVACTGKCAAQWPPLTLPSGMNAPIGDTGVTGTLGMVNDPGGAQQVTYNGWPLYGWVKDKKPGDTTGEKVGGKWFVVTPNLAPAM
jgi:predicted lipoprotein with Yx(FWY)xxD motif